MSLSNCFTIWWNVWVCVCVIKSAQWFFARLAGVYGSAAFKHPSSHLWRVIRYTWKVPTWILLFVRDQGIFECRECRALCKPQHWGSPDWKQIRWLYLPSEWNVSILKVIFKSYIMPFMRFAMDVLWLSNSQVFWLRLDLFWLWRPINKQFRLSTPFPVVTFRRKKKPVNEPFRKHFNWFSTALRCRTNVYCVGPSFGGNQWTFNCIHFPKWMLRKDGHRIADQITIEMKRKKQILSKLGFFLFRKHSF